MGDVALNFIMQQLATGMCLAFAVVEHHLALRDRSVLLKKLRKS